MNEKLPKDRSRITNSTFGVWYVFIIETIVNLLTNGPADYTLTKKEMNHKETPKDILEYLLHGLVFVMLFYLWINYIKKWKEQIWILQI